MSDFFGDGWFDSGATDYVGTPVVDAGTFDTSSDGSGWFNDIVRGLGGASSLTKLLGGAAGVIGNTVGANQASAGAERAAAIQAAANAAALDKILAAQKESRDVMTARGDRGLGDIDAGLASYKQTVAPLLTPNPIVLPQYRGLTPQQQIGVDDLRRNGLATISAAGLRGAGRAGIGAVMDQERRFRADAAATNDADTRQELRRAQGVANTARQGQATAELQTGGAKANTNLLVGNGLASSLQAGGNAAGALTTATGNSSANAASTAGNIAGQSTIANSNLVGNTLGSLGAIFADQQQQARGNSYSSLGAI